MSLARGVRIVAVAGMLVLLGAGATEGATHPFPSFGQGCARDDFTSDGIAIRAERCGSGTDRAVVVLHGCGGFNTFDHTIAADLPRYGIATLYVDYFAPTPPPGTKGWCNVWTRPRHLFATWTAVAADAANHLRSRYRHVGAVGWSLGAGVALATAEDRRSFAAVAAFSALASPVTVDRAGRLPPTIFLDGGPRDIVPPENARALYAAATAAHVPSALFIYPNGTHNWSDGQGQSGLRRAAAFLRHHLP